MKLLEAGVLLQRRSGGATMDLQIEQRESEGIVILDLEGRLGLGGEDISLLQRLLFLLERTAPQSDSELEKNLRHRYEWARHARLFRDAFPGVRR